MRTTGKKLLIIVFVGVAALFLYFYGGAIMHGGIDGIMSENNKLAGDSFGIVPALFIFCFGVFVGWLLFRKKLQSN